MNKYTDTELAKIRFSKIQLLSIGDELHVLTINPFYDSEYLFQCRIENIYSEKNHKVFICDIKRPNLHSGDLITINEFDLHLNTYLHLPESLVEKLDLYAKIKI